MIRLTKILEEVIDYPKKENKINESFDVVDALILSLLQGGAGLGIGLLGSYIAGSGLAKAYDWWKEHGNNSGVKKVVDKLKKDSDVKRVMKNPKGHDVKSIIKGKLSSGELNGLKKLSEGVCEREPGESDEDFLTRCGNMAFDKQDRLNMAIGNNIWDRNVMRESDNTNPSSKLRPEPSPGRHQTEHPKDEKDAFPHVKAVDKWIAKNRK